ncbi:MAG: DUF3299 domain-containing protein [Longimicrobiales bacterium]
MSSHGDVRRRRGATSRSSRVFAVTAIAFAAQAALVGAGSARDQEPSAPALAVETDTTEVDWRLLAELDFKTGKKTPALEKVDGKIVKMPGFMVPLEDGADGVTEFLLVPYFGACIHVPPPPPNQIVYVRMQHPVRVDLWSPVWVIGPLRIENSDSYYGTVGYQLDGQRIRPYDG